MFNSLSNIELEEILEYLKKNPPEPSSPPPEPKWHEGMFKELAKGVGQGPADILSHASLSEYTPDPLKKNTLALNPEETGWAGHITHSLGHSLSSFLAGRSLAAIALRLVPTALSLGPLSIPMLVAGGAIGVALAYGRRVYEDFRDEGVDATTATKVGLAAGSIAGIGGGLTSQGKTAVGSIATGAGINLGASLVDKGTTKQTLKSNGYNHLSDQIDLMDTTSIAADIIIGGYFGYTHYKHKGRNIEIKPKPSEVDTAMGTKTDIYAMHDLNPGSQMNNESSELYYRNFEKAQEAFLKGEDFIMNPQEAEKLTQGTLFHPSEPLPPIVEKKLETFEQKIKSVESFVSKEASNPLRKDLHLVKNKIYETALSCFYEHGGR